MKSAGEPKGSAANNDDRVGLGDSHCEMRWGTSTRWSNCSISIVTQLSMSQRRQFRYQGLVRGLRRSGLSGGFPMCPNGLLDILDYLGYS